MEFLIILLTVIPFGLCANILMITMAPTLSHKMPFTAYGKGLIASNHNVTFVHGFPTDNTIDGIHEITPLGLVNYLQNFSNWDLISGRQEKTYTLDFWEMFEFEIECCDAFLPDPDVTDLLKQQFDLMIIDGVFTECALALQYRLDIPFIFFNTINFAADVLATSGNPVPYSVVPTHFVDVSDSMSFYQKIFNAGSSLAFKIMRKYTMAGIHGMMRKHLGNDIPPVNHMKKNTSFILLNGHYSVTYPRPYLPNVAEVACLHCKPATLLPKHLESFINGSGEAGFVYVSMGSSVKTTNTPKYFFEILLNVFASMPFHVLWKWDTNMTGTYNIPSNVKIERWLPQQDILGHRKIRAFFTHGGLFSLLETVYHGVPIVVLPIFYDQDANAAAAVANGFGLVIQVKGLTAEKVHKALSTVVYDPKYRSEVKKRQGLLRDQRTPPLETAIYWTEYVLKYKGAYHLQSPARLLGFAEYYCFDVMAFLIAIFLFLRAVIFRYMWIDIQSTSSIRNSPKLKIHLD